MPVIRPETVEEDRGPLLVIDRSTGKTVEEPVLGGAMLRLAYQSKFGPMVRATLLRTGFASRLLGWYTTTRSSTKRIRPVIDDLGIDESEFLQPAESYATFHDFFVRRLREDARPWDPSSNVFSSPADARLTVFPEIDGTTAIPIKGHPFSLESLAGCRPDQIAAFEGGLVLVLRLCPADYHRFHYPTDGDTIDRWEISGRYGSVNPMALRSGLPIFTENRRVVSLLELKRFGRALFVEVGAFGVGGITQTHLGTNFSKMHEKGFFHYGASTLVLVLERSRLVLDADLVASAASGLEVLVRAGETLGTAVS
jgi:phosphatidylserine decarboxylase